METDNKRIEIVDKVTQTFPHKRPENMKRFE